MGRMGTLNNCVRRYQICLIFLCFVTVIYHLKCIESVDFDVTCRSLFADFIGYTKTDKTRCDLNGDTYNYANLAIESCNNKTTCDGFAELSTGYYTKCKRIGDDTADPVEAAVTYVKGKDSK